VRAGEGWRGLIIAVHRTSPMTQVLVEDFTFLSCVFLSFFLFFPITQNCYLYYHYRFAFCLLISHDLLIAQASTAPDKSNARLFPQRAGLSFPLPSSPAFSIVLLYVDASPPDQVDDGDGNDDPQAALAFRIYLLYAQAFSFREIDRPSSHHPTFRRWWWCDQGLWYGPGHAPTVFSSRVLYPDAKNTTPPGPGAPELRQDILSLHTVGDMRVT
jgi:hypothetical protein